MNGAFTAANNGLNKAVQVTFCYVTGEYPGSFSKTAAGNALIDSGGLALRIGGYLRESAAKAAEDDGPEGALAGLAVFYVGAGSTLIGTGVDNLVSSC